MSQKETFVNAWQNEYPTTLKVLKSFPADKLDFKPHERSQSAQTLARNFVLANIAIQQALDNKFELPPNFPPPPKTWNDLVSAYQREYETTIGRVRDLQDSDLQQTMRFLVAPGKMQDIPKIQFLWFIFCDTVHHRGQLSVYLRMAGGKVPSIYGPSADEPWM